jgi:ATP-dependent DNA helicase RecG
MDSHPGFDSKTPLHLVPGIRPHSAAMLEKMGLKRAIDLLFFFPRTYQDVAPTTSGLELADGLRATVHGVVVDADSRYSAEGRSTVGILIGVACGSINPFDANNIRSERACWRPESSRGLASRFRCAIPM